MTSNKFNNFFVNVWHTLAKSIPSSYKNPTDYISYSAVNAFYLDPVTDNEICKIIGTFKDRAAGWDDMRANVIKHIKEIVCIPLLRKYGIPGVEVQWFCEYLSNRMQYVTYNNHKSQKEKITCGVPLGSKLGLLLFLLYINDLANVSSHCFSISFAGDTSMFISDRNLDAN